VAGRFNEVLALWLFCWHRKSEARCPGAKVSGSPVVSGTGITQTVNETHNYYTHPTGDSPRRDKIHERQVESLIFIHTKLEEALFYFQRAAAAGKFAGEASDEELLKRMAENLAVASKEYAKCRLLPSEGLGEETRCILQQHALGQHDSECCSQSDGSRRLSASQAALIDREVVAFHDFSAGFSPLRALARSSAG